MFLEVMNSLCSDKNSKLTEFIEEIKSMKGKKLIDLSDMRGRTYIQTFPCRN